MRVMLPLSPEKKERSRLDSRRFAEMTAELRARLGLETDGGDLHGLLIPIGSRIRGEGWDLVTEPSVVMCFFGGENMEAVSCRGDEITPLAGVSRVKFSSEDEAFPEILFFECAEGGSIQVRLRGERSSDITLVIHRLVADYEETYAYFRFSGRPLVEQIKLFEQLASDGNGFMQFVLGQVMRKSDPDLFSVLNEYLKRSKRKGD